MQNYSSVKSYATYLQDLHRSIRKVNFLLAIRVMTFNLTRREFKLFSHIAMKSVSHIMIAELETTAQVLCISCQRWRVRTVMMRLCLRRLQLKEPKGKKRIRRFVRRLLLHQADRPTSVRRPRFYPRIVCFCSGSSQLRSTAVITLSSLILNFQVIKYKFMLDNNLITFLCR